MENLSIFWHDEAFSGFTISSFLNMTTNSIVAKRRRYLTGDAVTESDDDGDQEEISSQNPQKTTKRRFSATADLASLRPIVSERQQLAVLKQLTATDETSLLLFRLYFLFVWLIFQANSSINQLQQRPTKIFRRNEHGETIVHIAARKGDVKQLKKALREGANVNEEDNAGKSDWFRMKFRLKTLRFS